jgi:hypothetical protein
MKRILAATLVLALITPALPAFAADPSVPASTMSLRDSARQAAAQVGPRSLPRQPNDGARMQGGGGGKTGMIIGLLSAAAGIGLTVYMVKYMKKTTDAASKTN